MHSKTCHILPFTGRNISLSPRMFACLQSWGSLLLRTICQPSKYSLQPRWPILRNRRKYRGKRYLLWFSELRACEQLYNFDKWALADEFRVYFKTCWMPVKLPWRESLVWFILSSCLAPQEKQWKGDLKNRNKKNSWEAFSFVAFYLFRVKPIWIRETMLIIKKIPFSSSFWAYKNILYSQAASNWKRDCLSKIIWRWGF